MKKRLAQMLVAAMAVLPFSSCTSWVCPVCQGAGLQVVYRAYQTHPGSKYYKEMATVPCLSCGGCGRNWSSWFGFIWAVDATAHTVNNVVGAVDHGRLPGPPRHGGGPHGGPRR